MDNRLYDGHTMEQIQGSYWSENNRIIQELASHVEDLKREVSEMAMHDLRYLSHKVVKSG